LPVTYFPANLVYPFTLRVTGTKINIRETTYDLIKYDIKIILIKWEIIGVITRIIIGHKGNFLAKQ